MNDQRKGLWNAITGLFQKESSPTQAAELAELRSLPNPDKEVENILRDMGVSNPRDPVWDTPIVELERRSIFDDGKDRTAEIARMVAAAENTQDHTHGRER